MTGWEIHADHLRSDRRVKLQLGWSEQNNGAEPFVGATPDGAFDFDFILGDDDRDRPLRLVQDTARSEGAQAVEPHIFPEALLEARRCHGVEALGKRTPPV